MASRLLDVTVRAGSRRREVTEKPDGSIVIYTTTAPEKGKANADVVDMLADYLDIPRSCVEVVRGHTSPRKRIKITA